MYKNNHTTMLVTASCYKDDGIAYTHWNTGTADNTYIDKLYMD